MPSEERIALALEALAGPIEKHRSAVVLAAEEVRGFLASRASDESGGDAGVAATLGAFAAGRIDFDRFGKLLSDSGEDAPPDTLRKAEAALEVLRALSSAGNAPFSLKLAPGARLRDAVAGRLSEIGRGFAAARLAGLATAGALGNGDAEELLGPLGFDAWSSGERQLAPPLVIELEGADLRGVDLAEFLDGNVKIALVANGEAPPAPLVRLITPRTFVLQTSEPEDLRLFADAEPPAVAALLPSSPSSVARFVHDPSRGSSVGARLSILWLPEEPPRKKLGGMSVRQQQEELDQLRALAAIAAEGPGAASTPAAQMTSVDKLAAWLLAQTDLGDPE